MTMYPETCARCGRRFMANPYLREEENHYCSKRCRGNGTAMVRVGLPPDSRKFNPETHKKCPRCGVVFARRFDRGGGSPYCRGCATFYAIKAQHKPSDVVKACAGCGAPFRLKMRQVYVERYGLAPSTYCTSECYHKSTSISPDGYCVAPCRPSCPFPVSKHGLCQGHDQRKKRGQPLDTPLQARLSAALRAAKAGRVDPSRPRIAATRGF